MTRRDVLCCVGAVMTLALALSVLASLDRRRARRSEATLRQELCSTPVPEGDLERVARFMETPDEGDREARTIVTSLSGSLGLRRNVRLFFEHGGRLWNLDAWSCATPTGAAVWPLHLARWEDVAWSEGCRSSTARGRVTAARTVRTAGGRFFVIVLDAGRESVGN